MNKTQRQFAKSGKKLGVTKWIPSMGSKEASRWKREGAAVKKIANRRAK